MKDVLDDIDRWRADGHRIAVARVVGTEGSGPRESGATMAVNDAGEVAGSVSGGCVEGAVVEASLEVLNGTRDRGVITFGYSDDEAFAVGLTCGGTIHLFIEPAEQMPGFDLDAELAAAISAHRPIALATIIDGPNIGSKLLLVPDGDPLGTLGDPDLERVVAR